MKCNERIKTLREDHDKTQSDIADLLNIGQRTYSDYETGTTRIPPDVLIELSRFYNTSVDYLLDLTEEKKPYPRSKK